MADEKSLAAVFKLRWSHNEMLLRRSGPMPASPVSITIAHTARRTSVAIKQLPQQRGKASASSPPQQALGRSAAAKPDLRFAVLPSARI